MSWPNPRPDSMFLPKGRCRGSMCSTCPFQPDASGLGLDHPDFQPGGSIIEMILMGLPFYCHETIYSPLTTFDREGPDMSDGPQAHFLLCKGAVQFKQGKIELPTRERKAVQS